MSTWHGFVDDLSPVGVAPPASPVLGLRAIADTDLLAVARTDDGTDDGTDDSRGLRVVLTGGAAQVDGPLALAVRRGRRVAALDTALRDPGDLVGNVRRVLAALAAADAPQHTVEDLALHVRVPGPPTPAGLAVLDELAGVEAVVALAPDAPGLEQWLDAALDREVRVSLVGGAPDDAVDAVLTAARLWGDPGDADVGRRFVVSWLTDDVTAAVTHLDGLT